MVVHLDIVVFGLFAVNLAFDFVPVVVQDEEVRLDTSAEHRSDFLQSLLLSAALVNLCGSRTSCREPSPTNRTVRRSSPVSFAARAAPRHAPTDQPIAPHRI